MPIIGSFRSIYSIDCKSSTYGHRLWNIGHPVRSAIHKPQIGGLVVGSVTTSEYPLLYVFVVFICPFLHYLKLEGRVEKKATIPYPRSSLSVYQVI